jgi:hypothetical protein
MIDKFDDVDSLLDVNIKVKVLEIKLNVRKKSL